MADGTLDFADLLAAFDEPQPVTLQQIGSRHVASGLSLDHQSHIAAQNHAQFPHANQRLGGPQIHPEQIYGNDRSTGLSNPSFIQPDVAQAPACSEETFGGGSLGSLFLSSVESQLSDQVTNYAMQIPQPGAQARAVPRNARQQRQKPNTVQSNRVPNLKQIRNLQNASTQQYVNIAPAVDLAQTTGRLLDSGLNSNVLNAVSSPPFVIPPDMQMGTAHISLTGQQKMQQRSFVHPTQSTWQQQPPVNPPRPLSAASSTSEHMSCPGSIPQPSPSCGSNHSGDPTNPLTPQSYNAGTPQSYNAGTPQSYNAGTPQSYNPGTPQSYNAGTPQSYKPATPQSYNAGNPQSYNAGTPQSYKPATPQSYNAGTPQSYKPATPQSYNAGTAQSYKPATPQSYNAGNTQSYKPATPQSYNAGTTQSYKPATPQSYNAGTLQSNLAKQPRQRSNYGDIHPPQVPSGGGSENFISNQHTGMVFQPPPLQTMSISNDTLSDLPTSVNDALDTVSTSSSPYHVQPATVSNQHQVWNQESAVMSPSALFTNTAQSEMPTTLNFIPSNAQRNFGYTDMYGVQLQPGEIPQRPESNVRSESLTSKQNQLLEQLSSFGKNKTKLSSAAEQPNRNLNFDSGIAESGALKYLDYGGNSATLLTKQPGNSETINMMNKANNAGATAVKELLGAHTQYEAISPVSDYGMSPARKSRLHEDLSESLIFSPPKFSSASELSLPQDMDQSRPDPMTDPVLVYLKHDGDKSTSKSSMANNISSNTLSGSYFSQDVTSSASDISTSWLEQNSSSIVGSRQSNPQPSYIPRLVAEVPTLPILPATLTQSTNPQYMTPWNSQIESSAETSAIQSKVSQSALAVKSSTAKHPTTRPGHTTSPSKQKAQVASSQGTKRTNKIPFGIGRRKSSSEKSKFASLKQKKAPAIDEKFGFDSDDDTEPTICLSKPLPKSNKKLAVTKPQSNLLSPKPRIANSAAGEELKNMMEHLKNLHQQQATLRKIQEYQAQHNGGLRQPVGVTMSMHRSLTTHPTSTNPARQTTSNRKVSQETVLSYNEQQQPIFPSFPVTKETTKTMQSAKSKKQSLEFPATLSLTQPSISHKFGDMSKVLVGGHDIQPALPQMAHSSLVQTPTTPSQVPHFRDYLNPAPEPTMAQSSLVQTPTIPSQVPYFRGYLNPVPEPTRSVQEQRPSIASSPLLTTQQYPLLNTAPSVAPVSAPLDIQSHLLNPSNTSAPQMSYSSNISHLHTDVRPRSSHMTFQSEVSLPSGNEKDSRSAPSVLLPKTLHPHTDVRPRSSHMTFQSEVSLPSGKKKDSRSASSVLLPKSLHLHTDVRPRSSHMTFQSEVSLPSGKEKDSRSASSVLLPKSLHTHTDVRPRSSHMTFQSEVSLPSGNEKDSRSAPSVLLPKTLHTHTDVRPRSSHMTFQSEVSLPSGKDKNSRSASSVLLPKSLHLHTDVRPRSSHNMTFQSEVFLPSGKEKDSRSASSVLLPKSLPSSRTQPIDNTNFNLDWLHKESEAVVTERHKTPVAIVQPWVSSSLNIPASVSSKPETPLFTTLMTPVSKATATFSIPEDHVLPLKQSIHTVHHLEAPRPQPVSIAQTPVMTSKENAPVLHETKHLNLKKHRILEGAYLQSPDTYKVPHTTQVTSQSTSVSSTMTHSVLDKQRRYSKERITKPRHRIQHQVMDILKPQPSTTSTLPNNSHMDMPTSNSSKTTNEEQQLSESGAANDDKKDDQAGSMLLLFNSLLQEASQSVKDSLKTSVSSKQDDKPSANDDLKSVKPTPAVPNVTDPQISKAVTSTSQATKTLPGTVMTSCAMQSSSTRNVMQTLSTTNVMQTLSTTNVMQTSPSQTLPSPKKSTKKNRPAATVPFKLRKYPAFDDSQTATVTTKALTSAPAVLIPSVTTSVPIATKASLNTPSSKVTTTITTQSNLPITKPDSVMTTSSATNSFLTAKKEAIKSSMTEDVAEKLPIKSSGLPKLRITTFRSSKGEIIHQSALLGKVVESVDSSSSTHSKRKKKKKKKRRKELPSSDCDPTVSVSKVNPVSEQSAILVKEAKMNERIMKELEKKAEAISKSVETTTAAVKENVEEGKVTTRKRNKAKATSESVTDTKKPAKRVRVAKAGAKKKQDNKVEEPVIRYQPKSALQASSSTSGDSSTIIKTSVSLPSTFHRAPGKLPLYLSSSEAKSANTVPTIQLVARNTKLIGTAETISSPPTKVVSVKMPNSLQSKSFPTHLLSNARVLLPNVSITTPVKVPVSIVSPLLTRSFSGGFVPASILPTTSPSTSTKPQLFSVGLPISLTDSLTTPIKIVNAKHNATGKSRLSEASSVTDTALNLSLPITKALSKSSSILTKLTIPSVTVTRTLTTPRVATKVLSPIASAPMTANAFQSTFLKLISSQNPIPSYSPPSPPAYLEMDSDDKEHHQCLECKDSFMFTGSLDNHYQRKCILIKVRCMQCDQDLVFLNKCKLLFHARQHSDKGGNGMQFNNAHISPLPMSMCKPRTKESFLKTNSSSASDNKSLPVSNSEEDAASAGTSVGTPATYPTMLACTDCNFCGTTPEALEEHFRRTSSPGSPGKATGSKPSANFSCDMCNVTVPNQCSFNAHMRMHKRTTPHTCPECGQTFDNDGLQEQAYSESRREIDFKLHLSLHCFHLSRMSAFKCKLCTSIFKNADLLRRHLEVRHLQTFYKCHNCPMAFKTQDNISSHQRSAHGVVSITKTIHKCPLCEKVFTDSSTTQQLFLLQKHFEGHMNHPSINITAYKCLFCNNIYERKCLLRDHLKSVHDVTASGDGGGSSDELSKKEKEARLLLDVDKNDCSSLNVAKKRLGTKVTDNEPAAKILKISSPGESAASNVLIASGIIGGFDGSRKSLFPNTSDDSPTMMKSAKQPLKLRLKGMTSRPTTGVSTSMEQTSSANVGAEMNPGGAAGTILRDGRKIYPCEECSKELPSASARLNHIRLKHKGIKTMYCCPHCPPGKIKFAKKISVKKHLKKEHGIDEVTKQDVVTEHVQLPVEQIFDSAVANLGKGNLQAPPSLHKGARDSCEHKVRKKVTALRRKPNRLIRQVRKDLENRTPYVENSDTEVEQIMNSNYSNAEDTKKSDNEEVDFSLLKLPDSYACAKCEFQCKDRIEFQVHIMDHREDAEHEGILSATQQCTECGLCFASGTSHAKHLFIKHKIKRRRLLQKYDQHLKTRREASGSLPGPLSGDGMSNAQNGPGARNKHKCSVCYKRFDDDVQLRTHMRTHGLAFVRSKHAS